MIQYPDGSLSTLRTSNCRRTFAFGNVHSSPRFAIATLVTLFVSIPLSPAIADQTNTPNKPPVTPRDAIPCSNRYGKWEP
ncbi:hypothetical protein [Rosistilla oblonga]|uniref:hypothetical protein n=1 Tax=Rosistilla oblonga TaxID=2527990 RepID=UPI003A987C9D